MNNDKIKHLEFIQNIITGMNACSFKLKGWMITINSALLALCASSMNNCSGGRLYLMVGFLPTVLFWLLDSYYLQQERKFRGLYNDVINGSVKNFEMPLGNYNGGKYSLCNVVFSVTEWPLYVLTLIGFTATLLTIS